MSLKKQFIRCCKTPTFTPVFDTIFTEDILGMQENKRGAFASHVGMLLPSEPV